jgi:hypothetical protein
MDKWEWIADWQGRNHFPKREDILANITMSGWKGNQIPNWVKYAYLRKVKHYSGQSFIFAGKDYTYRIVETNTEERPFTAEIYRRKN